MLKIGYFEFGFVLFILSLHNTVCQQSKFFRNDYIYIESTDSFYKFNTLHKTWKQAKASCALEGSTLFYPQDEEEAEVVVEFWNRTQPYDAIFIGISDNLAKGLYETIDGFTIDEVYNKWRIGEPNDYAGVEDCVVMYRQNSLLNDFRCDARLPFICKKPDVTVEWDIACDLPYSGYTFNYDLNRCYKLHLVGKSWTDAHAACRAEQSYLAVINSQLEDDHLVSIVANATKEKKRNISVYLGFHKYDNDGWKTIAGVPLAESGFAKWSDSQPDGIGFQECGTMMSDGTLHDMKCSQKNLFICEHEISRSRNTYDFDF